MHREAHSFLYVCRDYLHIKLAIANKAETETLPGYDLLLVGTIVLKLAFCTRETKWKHVSDASQHRKSKRATYPCKQQGAAALARPRQYKTESAI